MNVRERERVVAPAAKWTDVPVLVHAPLRRDAKLICEVAAERGCGARTVESADTLADELADHRSVLVCSQEGLTRKVCATLERVLAEQPPWSRLPIVLILDRALDNAGALPELAPLMLEGDVIVLHRPMRPLAFTTAIDAALAARRRQLEIRDHLQAEAELRRELQHRVKNALATVLAVYQISLRESCDLEDLDQRFTERANALVAVQGLLDGMEDAPGDLRAVIEAVLRPYLGLEPPRIVLDGPPRAIGRRFASSFALVLNELATNAAKYGALSNEQGVVRIAWSGGDGDDGTFRLDWRETGGPPVTRPDQPGYGTRFIEGSLRALRAEGSLDYRPDGMRLSLTAPASALEQ